MKHTILDFYFSPEGRVNSQQFWRGLVVPFLALNFLAMVATPPDLPHFLPALYFVLAISVVPSIYVSLKRLHDMGFSGWCLLFGLTPIFGPFVLLIWLGFWPSNKLESKHGEVL
ncbi:MAG: DUF805 domain-containing protein [Micropepsaceae bacterium]